ncbi:hypothetical protein AB5N19_12160 [Seiridium cardinale]
MASELPSGVLGNLASSVKSIVTGQSNDADTTHTKIQKTTTKTSDTMDVDVDEAVEAHHDSTTIHKDKVAAVVHEDVKPHEHEKVDTVVDKEVHKDHYHTTIQPVKDTKVLPTKHVYEENESEREIDHRDNKAQKKAKQEAALIHDEKKVEGTTHTKEFAPTKEGEHIHHHIHETIQPVIERETIQEKVIHTTNHIHETEHLKDEHHSATVAPAITMADFEKGHGDQPRSSVTKVESGKGHPTSHSTSVTKQVSMSDFKKGQTGEAVESKKNAESKKRAAPTEDVDIDIDAATKVGKLDATEASNPLTQ